MQRRYMHTHTCTHTHKYNEPYCTTLGARHLGEGKLSHEFLPKEHHPSHPEEEDVVACLQQVTWIEELQVSSLRSGWGDRREVV